MVNEYWQQKYRNDAAKNWNLFYRRNDTRFFKDRHWIQREFPELFHPSTQTILEAGCGVGNFALPLLDENPNVSIYACDFSPHAIDLLQKDERYTSTDGRCKAFVADLTIPSTLTTQIPKEITMDIVTLIFVLSAIPPEKFNQAICNVHSVLKSGGIVLLRDYSREDAALKRFKEDRQLADSLFVRQDGTLAYYFTEKELEDLFISNGFEVIEQGTVHSKTTNVKRELDLDRYFIQAKYRKL